MEPRDKRMSTTKKRKSKDGWSRTYSDKLKGCYGITDYAKKKITINKKRHKKDKESILDTIVHEEMHKKHPSMKEKTVRKLTPKKLKKMSAKEKSKLRSRYK